MSSTWGGLAAALKQLDQRVLRANRSGVTESGKLFVPTIRGGPAMAGSGDAFMPTTRYPAPPSSWMSRSASSSDRTETATSTSAVNRGSAQTETAKSPCRQQRLTHRHARTRRSWGPPRRGRHGRAADGARRRLGRVGEVIAARPDTAFLTVQDVLAIHRNTLQSHRDVRTPTRGRDTVGA